MAKGPRSPICGNQWLTLLQCTLTRWLITSICFCWNHKCFTCGGYRNSRSSSIIHQYATQMSLKKRETAVCALQPFLLDDGRSDHWLLQIGLWSPGHGSTLLTWSVCIISSDYWHLSPCWLFKLAPATVQVTQLLKKMHTLANPLRLSQLLPPVTRTQTELTMNSIGNLEEGHSRLTKEKIATQMTEQSLQRGDNRIKFYTVLTLFVMFKALFEYIRPSAKEHLHSSCMQWPISSRSYLFWWRYIWIFWIRFSI